jgi:hypothetical protein
MNIQNYAKQSDISQLIKQHIGVRADDILNIHLPDLLVVELIPLIRYEMLAIRTVVSVLHGSLVQAYSVKVIEPISYIIFMVFKPFIDVEVSQRILHQIFNLGTVHLEPFETDDENGVCFYDELSLLGSLGTATVSTSPSILQNFRFSHLIEAISQGVFICICIKLSVRIVTVKVKSLFSFEEDTYIESVGSFDIFKGIGLDILDILFKHSILIVIFNDRSGKVDCLLCC